MSSADKEKLILGTWKGEVKGERIELRISKTKN